jgi:hypothetical protein
LPLLSSAETWFAILFVSLVEVVPASVKTSVLGIFLFLINNLGGNCPGEAEGDRSEVLGEFLKTY